eukprot:6562049-Alexandrium_andersonii.AAC.1
MRATAFGASSVVSRRFADCQSVGVAAFNSAISFGSCAMAGRRSFVSPLAVVPRLPRGYLLLGGRTVPTRAR